LAMFRQAASDPWWRLPVVALPTPGELRALRRA